MTQLATRERMTPANGNGVPDDSALSRLVINNDLGALSPDERARFAIMVCEEMGLNWKTRPFDYISLNGKLQMYAKKDATEQLRKLHHINLKILSRENVGDCYVVTARATMPDGREDESTGAVNIGNLKGDNLANALMKAETKAKRRVTLSICGLGFVDESELETIRDVRDERARGMSLTEKIKAQDDEPPKGGQNDPAPVTAASAGLSDADGPHGPHETEFLKACRDKGYDAIQASLILVDAQRKETWQQAVAADPDKAWQRLIKAVAAGKYKDVAESQAEGQVATASVGAD